MLNPVVFLSFEALTNTNRVSVQNTPIENPASIPLFISGVEESFIGAVLRYESDAEVMSIPAYIYSLQDK